MITTSKECLPGTSQSAWRNTINLIFLNSAFDILAPWNQHALVLLRNRQNSWRECDETQLALPLHYI